MNSSTFGFNKRRRRSRYSQEGKHIAVFGAAFACLTIIWSLIPGLYPLIMEISPPTTAGWYLGNANGQVEQFSIYDNLDGAADSLRNADVLFVGDSLMLFAFQDQSVLKTYFGPRGLRYFFLAFGGESDAIFSERIIRKFNLHPKWVIVDAEGFFEAQPTAAATRAMSSGSLEAREFRFEAETSLAIDRRIHQVFPYLGLSQWDSHPQWIWYRSKSDGTMWLAAWRGNPSPIPYLSYSDWLSQQALIPPSRPRDIEAAEHFKKELESRGAKLLLTWIPPNPGHHASQMAAALHVPLIGIGPMDLNTIDGQHLDPDSSSTFSKQFLGALDRFLGQVQR